MSENAPTVKSAPAAPSGAEHEPAEWRELLRLWREHGRAVAVVLVLILAALVYLQWRAAERRRAAAEGAAALAAAERPEQLEAVARDYTRTPSGPLALLMLASRQYQSGAFEAALTRYEEFLRTHSKHAMAAAAELGRLHALEALGRNEEALNGFIAFADAHPDHYLAPQAVFGRARGLARAGRYDEARVVYEDFIAAHPDSGWRTAAESALADLERARRATAPAAPMAPAAPAP